jgi:hypothetical protein
MKIKILGGIMIAALAITSTAKAQERTPYINHRLHNQERRINSGERDGELSRREAYNLRNEDRHIRYERRRDMADGRLTYGERRHLRRQENRTNRQIYHDRHDGWEDNSF